MVNSVSVNLKTIDTDLSTGIDNRYQSITTRIFVIDWSSIININRLIDIDCHRLSIIASRFHRLVTPGLIRLTTIHPGNTTGNAKRLSRADWVQASSERDWAQIQYGLCPRPSPAGGIANLFPSKSGQVFSEVQAARNTALHEYNFFKNPSKWCWNSLRSCRPKYPRSPVFTWSARFNAKWLWSPAQGT